MMHIEQESKRESYSQPASLTNRLPRKRHLLHPPSKFDAAVLDAIAWIGAAILLRVAVDALLSISPEFWLPGLLILVAPAAIAILGVTMAPQLSLIFGYRLLLMMFGLLLGGRL